MYSDDEKRGVIQMTTLDKYLVELNDEIVELKSKGNKLDLENVLALKTTVLKLMAKECVAEYKELYGEK
tara:strand:+ start:160 stop:366 length:207 start_codon:yes stop_codon:yes gene_type:complete